MRYPLPRKEVGQYRIIANRLRPDFWKVQVFDMDVPTPGGRFLYASEGWKTWRRAVADGDRFIFKMDELARFRRRVRYRRIALLERRLKQERGV